MKHEFSKPKPVFNSNTSQRLFVECGIVSLEAAQPVTCWQNNVVLVRGIWTQRALKMRPLGYLETSGNN
jgi:hypothetical protein